MHAGFSWVKPEGDYLKELGIDGTILLLGCGLYSLLRMYVGGRLL
jgi:hypothetical protein